VNCRRGDDIKIKWAVVLITCLLSMLCTQPAWPREKVNIAMILWRGTTDSETGFQDKLKGSEKYDFTFTVLDLNQDRAELVKVVDRLAAEPKKYAAIYAFGTTVVEELQKKIKDTPIVFTAVSRPVETGLVKTWEHSGNNTTGASNAVPMKNLITTLSQVLHIDRLGLLYNPKEPNAVVQRIEFTELEKELHFQGFPVAVESREAVPESIQKLVAAKVDAVVLPSDSMITNNAGVIVPLLNRNKIPSVTSIPEVAQEHDALLGLGPDYLELGKSCAAKVLAILDGEKPSDIPCSRMMHLHVVVNLKTARELGLNVPVQLLRLAQVIRQ